jgi:hypothetical protein
MCNLLFSRGVGQIGAYERYFAFRIMRVTAPQNIVHGIQTRVALRKMTSPHPAGRLRRGKIFRRFAADQEFRACCGNACNPPKDPVSDRASRAAAVRDFFEPRPACGLWIL